MRSRWSGRWSFARVTKAAGAADGPLGGKRKPLERPLEPHDGHESRWTFFWLRALKATRPSRCPARGPERGVRSRAGLSSRCGLSPQPPTVYARRSIVPASSDEWRPTWANGCPCSWVSLCKRLESEPSGRNGRLALLVPPHELSLQWWDSSKGDLSPKKQHSHE